ncbi:MAG: tetratricopeptide repeat protein [Chitinophagaceae bacterium]|nr:tetratricopeptide repeat protein [Anaerolineae bacterium]
MPTYSPADDISALIEQRTGLAARAQFGGDLDTLLETLAQGDLPAYLGKMRTARETDPVWQAVIKALTIGETYFMRDKAQFQTLRTHILPSLIAARRQQNLLELNIWSIGCASGEEPYSVAMTLHELIPDIAHWTIRLIGTDLNAAALNVARRGIYRKWAFRHTDIDFQNLYFDQATDGLQIKPFIREMVTFRHANLFAGSPLPQVDIILCRNVLLYFTYSQACQVELLLLDALTPGGWLLLGQSEAIRHNRDDWQTHFLPNMPIYQKPPSAAPRFAESVMVQSLALSPKAPTRSDLAVASATYEVAVRAIQNEDYDQAEQLIAELLITEPGSAPAHILMVCVFASRKQYAQAHKVIDTALRLDPLLADAHYLQALLFLEEEHLDEALKSLKAALYCQRNHPLASYTLGNLQAMSGDLPSSIRNWENARRAITMLMPDSPVSDISDITAGRLSALLATQLEG